MNNPTDLPHLSNFKDLGVKLQYPESEYRRRDSVYALAFDADGKIGTMKFIDVATNILPGGGVEEGETKEEALKREVREELGCNIENLKLIGSFDSFNNPAKVNYLTHIYTADIYGEKGEPTPTEDYEIGLEIIWRTMDELMTEFKRVQGDNEEDTRPYLIPKLIQLAGLHSEI